MHKKSFRIFSFLIILILILIIHSISALSATFEIIDSGFCGGEGDGSNLTWLYSSNGTLMITGEGSMVNSGSIPWKDYQSSITKVVLYSGVTTIGKNAFYNCSALAEVSIPDTVTEISYSAFSNCSSLKHISLPSSVTKLAYYVFQNCTSLETAVIPSSVTSIGKYTFSNCTALTSAVINANISSLSQRTFSGCTSLTSVSLSDSITYIDGWAFQGCSNLKTVVLPSKLQTIGMYSFNSCKALDSLVFPSTLKELHKGAFSDCSSLRSIEIPKTLTEVGESAFSNCTSLKTVKLNEGTTAIKSSAFHSCTNLVNINFPESLTFIGERAFYKCTSLENVELGQNIKIIGQNAFNTCTSLKSFVNPSKNTQITTNLLSTSHVFSNCPLLTSAGPIGSGCTIEYGWTSSIPGHAFCGAASLNTIVFPDTLISVGQYAFAGCNALTSLVFPASIVSLDYESFSQCDSLTDVYFYGDAPSGSKYIFPTDITIHYISTASGWTTPTWNGYSTVLWSGALEKAESIYVPSGQYCVHVVDEHGTSLSNVYVTFDDHSKYTDANGNAIFSVKTMGNPIITASKSKFITWSNNHTSWSRNPNRYETVILYPTEYGEYKLSSARYSTSHDYSLSVDLLTQTKKIGINPDELNIGSFTDSYFYISCQAYSSQNVTNYELWQSNKLIASSIDGNFQLSTTSFEKGGNCYVYVITNKSERIQTRLNLEFVEAVANKETKLSILSDKISFSVASNVPYLGGHTYSINLPLEPPIYIDVSSSGKILVGINLLEDKASPEKPISEAKSVIAAFVNSNGKLSTQQLKRYNNLISQTPRFKLGTVSDIDVKCIGYLEADPGSSSGNGQLMISLSYPLFKGEYNTVVYVVPVTVQYGMDFSGQLSAKIGYNFREARLIGDFSFKPSAKISAFVGVGISKAVGVGVYGSAELLFDIRVLGRPVGLQEVTLTGDLGVKAYLFNLEHHNLFAYNTWFLWSNHTTEELPLQNKSSGMLSQSTLLHASDFVVSDVSYLHDSSPQIPETGLSSLFSDSSTQSASSLDLKEILTSTYNNAQPSVVATDDGIYIAFLWANSSASIGTYLTKFNGIEWCTPVSVSSNPICHGPPKLYSDNNGELWLVFTETTSNHSADTLLDFSKNQQIVIGKIDPDTLALSNRSIISGVGYVHSPTLLLAADNPPILAWISSFVSTDQEVLYPTDNRVFCAEFDADGISSMNVLMRTSLPITSLSLAQIDNEITLILQLLEDAQTDLYTFSSSNGLQLISSNVNGKVCFGRVPGVDSDVIYWNEDDSIVTMRGDSLYVPGITNEYSILGNSIYYCTATELGNSLMVQQYTGNNSWTLPMQLTNTSNYLENLSVVGFNDENYVIAMHTSVEFSVKTVNGTENQVVNDTKNLVWTKVLPVSDLRLDCVEYEPSSVTPNSSVPLTLSITNAGAHTVEGISICQNSSTIETISCSLSPGSSLEHTVYLSCPNESTEIEFSIFEPNQNDYHPDDNYYTTTLGYGDIHVEAELYQIGNHRSVIATVTNNGVESADGIICFYHENGTPLAECEFTSVAAGDILSAELELDPELVGDGNFDITVDVAGKSKEYYTHNNTTTLYIPVLSYETEIIFATRHNSVVTSRITLEPHVRATAYFVTYSAEKQLLSIEELPLKTGINDMDLSFSHPNAVWGKLFVIDVLGVPLCETTSIRLIDLEHGFGSDEGEIPPLIT